MRRTAFAALILISSLLWTSCQRKSELPVLFTLPAGAWLDRVRRRPVLVAADIGRAVALLSIPVAHFAGHLSIGQLFVVAFVTNTLTAFFDIADQSFLPELIDRETWWRNARLRVSYSTAWIGGPCWPATSSSSPR
jgi:MFS family permease